MAKTQVKPRTPSIDGIPFARVIGVLAAFIFGASVAGGHELRDAAYHVFPGDDLQSVLNLAATNAVVKTVKVHAGLYIPRKHGQALIYLNRAHSGIHLLGLGRPVLSAANPDIADRSSQTFPAVVNHVIYLGDGLSTNTVVENFRITGANHFVTNSFQEVMEPDRTVRKGRFYFGDGGAVKIYHRSYPVLRDLEVVDNYASPCAGGISIQQEGQNGQAVLIENCVFRNNRAEVTGAALDLLWGSSARVINCLFVGNVSNTGPGEGENPFNNNGAVTVFPRSRIVMENCTLTGNRNAVDDAGGSSQFVRCIFAGNTLAGGPQSLGRYELDLRFGGTVRNCIIQGRLMDPRGAVASTNNFLNPVGFQLGDDFTPVGAVHEGIGYRPPGAADRTQTK